MEQLNDSTLSNQYSLSIRINSDGFSLAVIDESKALLSTKKVSALMNSLSTEEIIRLINTEIQLNFKDLHLIYESDNYIFVPASIFRSNEATDYLNFQQKPAKDEVTLYNTIPVWDIVNIFSIPANIPAALNQLFINTPIEQHVSYFLSEKVTNQHETSIYIWVRSKIMDTIVLKNGKLQLLNSFPYQTPEDFTYQTLNLVEQLSLDTDKCKVYLYNPDKKIDLQKTLEKYITVVNL